MYKIIENYRDQKKFRNQFLNLTKIIFPSIDFVEWYKQGYWADEYIPFSIFENEQIISNVSISKMNILVNGEIKNALQFGTVGTLPNYRKKGLSRILMEYVFDKYKDSFDLHYLFANETVTEFYPKFGFIRQPEVYFQRTIQMPQANFSALKIDLNNLEHKRIVTELINKRKPLTKKFGAIDYGFVTWWYIINFHSNELYYLPDEQIIFIAGEENNDLHIFDIIFEQTFEFEDILPKIIKHNNYSSTIYYFSPDVLNFNYDATIQSEESPLFIKGDFNLGQNLFKYPYTAQT